MDVSWLSGDELLDDALSRHFKSGFKISPYGLMIFRRMSHLKDMPRLGVIYGHLAVQKDKYVGKYINAICGEKINVYGISEISSFIELKQLDEDGLCESCCSYGEKLYWINKY